MTQFFTKKQKGFTLIELLVVIAVIGILSTIIVVNIERIRDDARNTTIQANIAQIRIEAELIYRDASPDSYVTLCTTGNVLNTTTPALVRMKESIEEQTNNPITCHADTRNYCVFIQLVDIRGVPGSKYFCIDHLGHSSAIPTTTCSGTNMLCRTI